MKKIALDIAIVAVFVVTAWFVYQQYGEQIATSLFGAQLTTIYVEGAPLSVSIADEPAEHKQGLSGLEELNEFEGKLFIFDQPDYYGMWMKDMNFAIDIFWIDNDLRIIHIEENVTPDTYPDSFASDAPARFVLETNAFFARDNNLQVGDVVRIPANKLPEDLQKELQ